MASFKIAYDITAKWEGGYSNHAADAGKETYKGISRYYWPKWAGWRIVDENKPLKTNQIIKDECLDTLVEEFYKTNFWDKTKGDLIDNQKVANLLYDWFVHSGSIAIKKIQRIIGADDDGKAGNETITKINSFNGEDLFNKLKQSRIDYVNNIVTNKPSQKVFLKGWLNRINSFK